ncbi:MAG: hypothetical protein LBP68_00305 [Acidobacteriota bacterium]|jgi:DNA repair exonuclease SbcCD ATPase subunit|nr:hypothetical protein [Acidobacteriota bacterium]
MTDPFEELVSGMPSEQKAEFYGILHKAGIGRQDVEIAKLFRALQLYRAYYEAIPASMAQAVAEIDRLKKEVGELVEQADQSAAASEKLLNRFTQEAAEVGESLVKLHSHVEEAAARAAVVVSRRMTEMLSEAMGKTLPLDALSQAGKTFSAAVAASNQASADLRKNIKVIRRAHRRAYALAACSVILAFWVYIHFQYERKVTEARAAILADVQGNQAVLSELAKARRTLELVTKDKDPRRRLLFMKDAKGWTTTEKHGVIEFRE